MHRTEKGLILREVSYRDADVMLTILTECDGKLSAAARGVRRKNSKLSAGVQFLAYSEFTLYENAGRYTINEAAPLELFFGIRNDIEKLALASYFAEVLNIAADAEVINPELLRLGLNSLFALSGARFDSRIIKAGFEMKIAALSGYAPSISNCSLCGRTPINPNLDIDNGAVYCSGCCDMRNPIDKSTYDALLHILNCDVKRIFSFTIPDGSMKSLLKITETYLRSHFERDFKTLTFYKSIVNGV